MKNSKLLKIGFIFWLLILTFFIYSCVTTKIPQLTSSTAKDFLVGIWSCPMIVGGIVEIKFNEKKYQYEMYQVSDESIVSEPGELIGELSFDEPSGNYIGRHKWGGSKRGPISWGRPGGMEIKPLGENSFFQVFLDSVYKGGWTFTRVQN